MPQPYPQTAWPQYWPEDQRHTERAAPTASGNHQNLGNKLSKSGYNNKYWVTTQIVST